MLLHVIDGSFVKNTILLLCVRLWVWHLIYFTLIFTTALLEKMSLSSSLYRWVSLGLKRLDILPKVIKAAKWVADFFFFLNTMVFTIQELLKVIHSPNVMQ